MRAVRGPFATARRLLALVGTLTAAAAPAGAAGSPWQRIEIEATGGYARWYVPPDLASAPSLPLVVFLHGAGSTPEAWEFSLTTAAGAADVAVLAPKSDSPHGWGIGRDAEAIAAAIEAVAAAVPIDRSRIGIAGYSSGGAFSYVLGLAGRGQRFSGIFALAPPYRTVLELGHPGWTPPVRLQWGAADPNAAVAAPLGDMLDRLGVAWDATVVPGHDHGSWPPGTLEGAFAFLAGQRVPLPGPCQPTATRLCLGGGRFSVDVIWRDGVGGEGPAFAVPTAADDSGLFWFFGADNLELLVKVLDGCWHNDRYWVFAAGTTTVEYRLEVRDLVSGASYVHLSPPGEGSPALTDTGALATCGDRATAAASPPR